MRITFGMHACVFCCITAYDKRLTVTANDADVRSCLHDATNSADALGVSKSETSSIHMLRVMHVIDILSATVEGYAPAVHDMSKW